MLWGKKRGVITETPSKCDEFTWQPFRNICICVYTCISKIIYFMYHKEIGRQIKNGENYTLAGTWLNHGSNCQCTAVRGNTALPKAGSPFSGHHLCVCVCVCARALKKYINSIFLLQFSSAGRRVSLTRRLLNQTWSFAMCFC